METFSALLALLCGEFYGNWWIPITKASDAELWCFFDLRLNKGGLSKQSWGWWFETPFRPVLRHCNGKTFTNLLNEFQEIQYVQYNMCMFFLYFVSFCSYRSSYWTHVNELLTFFSIAFMAQWYTVKPLVQDAPNKKQNKMSLVSSWSCLCPIHWIQMLRREWWCSWSSADRRCSNYMYIWVINNFMVY